jgi:regulator of RNase E activity RraA
MLDVLNPPILCGGVVVVPGDIVVADEEGIVVVPQANAADILAKAQAKAAKDAAETLDQWEAAHRARIDEILRSKGFKEG